jgi:hypothetical protein
MVNNTTAARWFRRIIWIGIVANLLLALPTLAAPSQMTQMASLPTATPDLWPRFSALLLILLSVFYIPAGLDIDRYRVVAWLAVVSRLTGLVFFSFEPAAYRVLGLFDGLFLVPLALCLFLAIRSGGRAAPAPTGVTLT